MARFLHLAPRDSLMLCIGTAADMLRAALPERQEADAKREEEI